MKTVNIVLIFALVSVSVRTLQAQPSAQPNFSGTWTLNLQKSKLPKKTAPKIETLIILQQGTTISAHYTTDVRQSTESYICDGKERVVREFQGGKLVSKARWKGAVLTTEIYGRIFDGSEVIHTTERWKTSPDGHELSIETTDPKQVSVYDKQAD